MSTRAKYIGGAAVLIVVLAAWYYYATRPPTPFPVSSSDHLSSWALPLPQDAASSTPRLAAQIGELSKMIGGGAYPDSDIYIGIANDYVLMGDGKAAYRDYEYAIAASSTYALAYDDLGGLFARLYATTSAERAYAKAVALTPDQLLFQLSYLDYIAEVEPNAPSTAAAFLSARQLLGSTNPDFLVAEANWLEDIGSTTGAIADWEIVAKQEPNAAPSIAARIREIKKQ